MLMPDAVSCYMLVCLSFYNQNSNDALNTAGQTTHDVCSVTVNFKESGQEVAAAVGRPITICWLSLFRPVKCRCAMHQALKCSQSTQLRTIVYVSIRVWNQKSSITIPS